MFFHIVTNNPEQEGHQNILNPFPVSKRSQGGQYKDERRKELSPDKG